MKKCQPKSLTPYLDGELAPDTRSQVEEHLHGCASCGALLDEVTSARERVRGMGRAVIPDTVLMPALEILREKGGIGQERNAQPEEIPVLVPASTVAVGVMDEDAATDVAEAEVDDDERYNAVVNAPGLTWVHVAPPVPMNTVQATPDAPVVPDPSVILDATVVGHWPAFSEPERADRTDDEPGTLPRDDFWAIADATEFSAPDPSSAASWLQPDNEEAISPEAQYALEASGAALDERPPPPDPQPRPPWAEAESADAEDIEAHGRRLVEEDLEAERIRAASEPWGSTAAFPSVVAGESLAEPEVVPEETGAPDEPHEAGAPVEPGEPDAPDEAIVPDEPAEPAAESQPRFETDLEPWRPHAPDPWEAPAILSPAFIAEPPADEAAAAVASVRGEPGDHDTEPESDLDAAPPGAASTIPAEPTTDAVVDGYRGALRTQAEAEPAPAGLASLSNQVKIGLGVAAAIVLLLAAVFGLPRLFTHRAQPIATAATTHPSGAPAASASPTIAAAPAPSPQASTAPVVPALTGTVSAGHAGTGYRVLRVRTRNPSPGLNLIVFDLQGPGALPDATLGQAADGSLYLQSPGTTIDPAIAAAFAGAAPVTSIAPTGGEGTSLKLSTSRPARFSLYYLTGPSRLVIELR